MIRAGITLDKVGDNWQVEQAVFEENPEPFIEAAEAGRIVEIVRGDKIVCLLEPCTE